MSPTEDAFDDLAEDYAEFRSGYSASLYDQLAEMGFKPGMRVLDVGCGTGIASEPLVARSMTVTGVDPSEPMLEHARTRIPAGTFVKGTAEKLPFKDGTFDAAICAQAMQWFDQPKAVAEMVRVVRPGGRVAVWWKKLTAEEAMRQLRAEVCATVGVDEPEDLMSGPFSAFYATPFKERWVRVVPHIVTTDAARWIGYERSRKRARDAYGAKVGKYFTELEKLIREKAGDRPFQVRYTQFLYVGAL